MLGELQQAVKATANALYDLHAAESQPGTEVTHACVTAWLL